MHDDTRRLHEAYRALVARAAAVGLLPATGLTPREQQGQLGDAPALPGSDVERLIALLEQCVYADHARPEDVDVGLALCDQLRAALPIAPEHDRRTRAWLGLGRFGAMLASAARWVQRFGPIVLVIALIGGSGTALVWNVGRAGIELGLPATPSTWREGYEIEQAAVEAHTDDWTKPPERGTLGVMPPPAACSSTDPLPQFDDMTGRDALAPQDADPFSPPLAWTHRLRAYPSIDSSYGFHRDPRVVAEAEANHATGVRFVARVAVNLRAGVPVPVPSPAPGAVVVDARVMPRASVRFVHDGGGGLCVISDRTQRARLMYRVTGPGGYRTASLPETPFTPVEIPLPPNVRADAERVAAAIGGLPAPTYGATVRRLHAYFAGFSVCPLEPADRRENEFLTIALARKGVCRHRARAFVPVAQALGVPARLVENRCHSFAEVQLPDGRWRRLEFRLESLPTSNTTMMDESIASDGSSSDGRRGGQPSFGTSNPVPLLLGYLVALGVAVPLLCSYYRDVRAHVVGNASQPSRAERRAHRDRGRAVRVAPAQLAVQVREQLAAYLDEDDPTALPRAVAASDMPPDVKRRALDVLGEGPRLPSNGVELQATFWTCASVLRWLEGRQRRE